MSIKSTTGPLHLGANSAAPAATFLGNGNLGIGVLTPSAKFHTNGTLRFQGLANNNTLDQILVTDANGNVSYRSVSTIGGSSSASWSFGGSTVAALKTFGTVDNYDLPVITNNIERMRISSTGAVLIGTNARPTGSPTTGAMLAIKGHIYAEKLKVTLTTGWADYVFDEEYKLRPLTEVESFVKQHHHLPEVPSAVEVEKNGIDVGDNQTILLKKIEELTLYLIEQNKKLIDQNKTLENQQKQIDDLKKELVRGNL
ncbi:hypothetical protein [Flavitalea sp.]|nr:hypothetical protein [Flavitalea sp.]